MASFFLFTMCLLLNCGAGARILQCTNKVNVEDGKDDPIRCVEYGNTTTIVTWAISSNGNAPWNQIALCNTTERKCFSPWNNVTFLLFVNENKSEMIIRNNSRGFDNQYVKCTGDSDAECQINIVSSSSATTVEPAGTTLTTNLDTSDHGGVTQTTKAVTSDEKSDLSSDGGNGDNRDKSSQTNKNIAGIAGGVAGAVLIIVVIAVVVIVVLRKRRAEAKRPLQNRHNHEVEEHTNVLYEAGDSPYEVNDGYQPTNQILIGIATRFDSADDDHNLNTNNGDDYALGNALLTADTACPQSCETGTGDVAQTDQEPSVEPDLYTAVDAQSPNISTVSSERAVRGDVYAVVDKSRQSKAKSEGQPDVYAHVDKSRSHQGGDVYAVVDKSSKRAVSTSPQQNIAVSDAGNYTEVQTPRPDTKPNPVLKPKSPLKPKSSSTSPASAAPPGDDEYNVLNFQAVNSQSAAFPDTEQYYSHISQA